MHDIAPFALVVVVAALALLAAVGSSRISEWVRIPTPALFLLAASLCADLFPDLGSLSIPADQRIVTIALVLILFDGGMHIGCPASAPRRAASCGWASPAPSSPPGRSPSWRTPVFDFDWRAALLLGTALAPTDPAVVFSVLGRREVGGRTGTLLEGESGANDPVGIALMVAILGSSGGGLGRGRRTAPGSSRCRWCSASRSVWPGGWPLRWLHAPAAAAQRGAVPAADARLRAACVYGVATVAHGSGFLAVFVAGILVGDTRAPYKREIERFHSAPASLAEIVAFTVLGLTRPAPEVCPTAARWLDRHRARGAPDPGRPAVVRRARARADPAEPRRARLRVVGRAQGRRPDPARHLRPRRRGARGRPHLRGDLRGRAGLGGRAGRSGADVRPAGHVRCGWSSPSRGHSACGSATSRRGCTGSS